MDNLADNFDFGFEIEGGFTLSLEELLIRTFRGMSLKIEGKSDGSVVLDVKEETIGSEELAIGVFDNFADMLKCLSLFKNNKNYFENESCGIHIHIKPKKDRINWRKKINSFELIDKVQQFVGSKLCYHTIERLNNSYCQKYRDFQKFYAQFKPNDANKYFLVRNHPQGTAEFRIFSTCEHKIDNIKKFFTFFFKELAKQKDFKVAKLEMGNPIKTKSLKYHSSLELSGLKTLNLSDKLRKLPTIKREVKRGETEEDYFQEQVRRFRESDIPIDFHSH